jgi:preprotein translocase subunit SecA
MQTGEGKTFAAVLPAFVHALTGRGVHVVTANRYLAGRDQQWLQPVYACLGVSVGLIGQQESLRAKLAAYACDVTYGPGYEFGFDYLRDQVALRARGTGPLGAGLLAELRGDSSGVLALQRGLAFAIIDEVDHVLLDDAGSPLVLAEQTPGSAPDAAAHLAAARRIATWQRGIDFQLDPSTGRVSLSAAAREGLYADPQAIPLKLLQRGWSEYLEQALRARWLYRRDVDYVVRGQQVHIVDTATGRIFADRSWRDGLHQAVEAKEGVPITAEKRSVARVTRQRFFRRYSGLCGMTGTATGSEREFAEFYRLPVVPIPLRRPSRRSELPPRSFTNQTAKWEAIAAAVREIHAVGRPVLVGTETIEDSETLSELLRQRGLTPALLNGLQDADEAEVVGQAGNEAAITIATNMAGRGTDIKLPPAVVARGGLHVIAAQRHASSRIDRQLIGRCARQGDPGSAQCFLAADDALLRNHGPRLGAAMKRAANARGEITVSVTRAVLGVQRRAERSDYHRRRQLFLQEESRERLAARLVAAEEQA